MCIYRNHAVIDQGFPFPYFRNKKVDNEIFYCTFFSQTSHFRMQIQARPLLVLCTVRVGQSAIMLSFKAVIEERKEGNLDTL